MRSVTRVDREWHGTDCCKRLASSCLAIATVFGFAENCQAQSAPSALHVADYQGLHRAAYLGNLPALRSLLASKPSLESRDSAGRTALHVATFASHEGAVVLLAQAGANLNALENAAYDVVTIAAVANDLNMLDAVLKAGASAANITSPYDGTALIAAAHLGHGRVVRRLIGAGAPLDHVNNLGWTALIEAVVLGNGGPNHIEVVKALIEAGADRTIADSRGTLPLEHARARGFSEMINLLEQRQ